MNLLNSFINEIEKLGGPVFYGYADLNNLMGVVNIPREESQYNPDGRMTLLDNPPQHGIPQKVKIEVIDPFWNELDKLSSAKQISNGVWEVGMKHGGKFRRLLEKIKNIKKPPIKTKILQKLGGKRELYPDVDEGMEEIKKNLGTDAELVGSSLLDIKVPGESDIDISIPYADKEKYKNDLKKFLDKYNLSVSVHAKDKLNKTILRGKGVDLALLSGPRAYGFIRAMKEGKRRLDKHPKEREMIVKLKKAIKDIPGNTEEERKLYYYLKRLIATRLGIRKYWDD